MMGWGFFFGVFFPRGLCCPTCCCVTKNYIFSEVRTKSSCFHCTITLWCVRSGNPCLHRLSRPPVTRGTISVLKVTAQVISLSPSLPARLYCIRRQCPILCCAVLSRRQRSCDVQGGRWIAVIHKRVARLLGSCPLVWLQTPILPVSCCQASSTAELLSSSAREFDTWHIY